MTSLASEALPDTALREMQRWVSDVVVGLDLCPFAAAVLESGRVRWVVSRAREPGPLAGELHSELQRLAAAPLAGEPDRAPDTTLLIHPYTLQSFEAYNEFLGIADELLAGVGLSGVIQIASFHPQYRFADSGEHDPENYSNRSPHPALHLLREESVARAIETHSDAAGIPARNAERLLRLGLKEVRSRLERCRETQT